MDRRELQEFFADLSPESADLRRVLDLAMPEVGRILGAVQVIYCRAENDGDHRYEIYAGNAFPMCTNEDPVVTSWQLGPLFGRLKIEEPYGVIPLENGGTLHVVTKQFGPGPSSHYLGCEFPESSAATDSGPNLDLMGQVLEFLAIAVNSKVSVNMAQTRRQRRQAFLGLMSASGRPFAVAEEICRVWSDLLRASAVRLWLHNATLEEFDLLAQRLDPDVAEWFTKQGNNLPMQSVAGKSLSNQEVFISKDPRNDPDWQRDGLSDDFFKQVPYMICVPLVLLPTDSQETQSKFGVLDIFLRETDMDQLRQPKERLLELGHQTAAAMARAHSYERRSVVYELNQLALDVVKPGAQGTSSQYVSQVIEIIASALQAGGVSIFQETEFGDKLQCIASTGIEGHGELKSVFYAKPTGMPTGKPTGKPGVTWNVYKNNKEVLLQDIRDNPGYAGLFREVRRVRPTEAHDPFLAVPLPQYGDKAIGVIRVLEKCCFVDKRRLQNFSDHDLELLQLIAHQVSPMLQIFELQKTREVFLRRIVHQVLQPIQGISNYSLNILDGIYGQLPPGLKGIEDKIRYIRNMGRSAARTMKMFQVLMQQDSTFERKVKSARREHVKLTKFLMELVIEHQAARDHDRIYINLLDTERTDMLGRVRINEFFLEQVVSNVLHNAVKFSYPETTITVDAQRRGKTLIVDVTSTGLPIHPSERQRIFNDSVRGLASQHYDPTGTGQGLYVSREIMRAMGPDGDLILIPGPRIEEVEPPKQLPIAELSTFRITIPEAF